MVNQNIQSPIIVGGPGHTVRRNGDYRSGEYKKLINAEIIDERIVNRRNIRVRPISVADYNVSTEPSLSEDDTKEWSAYKQNKRDVIGYWNDWTIYDDFGSINSPDFGFFAVKDDLSDSLHQTSTGLGALFDPTQYDADNPELVSPLHIKNIVGCFQYNKKFWFVLCGMNTVDASIDYSLLYFDDNKTRLRPNFDTTDGPTIEPGIISVTANDPNFARQRFRSQFLFKDRLWIATEGVLYFSASTDPTKFTVADDGGYFIFHDEKVNYVFSSGSMIYVVCESGLYSLTYGLGPNDDAVLTKVSNSMGGLWGCEYLGTPYVINNDGIFVIYNNYLEKVYSTDLDLGLNNYDFQRIIPFINYLTISKGYIANDSGLDDPADSLADFGYRVNLWHDPDASQDLDSIASCLGEFNGVSVTAPSATVTSDAVLFNTGDSSWKYTKSGTPGGTTNYGLATVAPDLPVGSPEPGYRVTPGKRYCISFYAQGTAASKTFAPKVKKFTSSGSPHSSPPLDFINPDSSSGGTLTGAWQRFYFFYTVPANTYYLQFTLGFSGTWVSGETINYDSFLMEEVDAADTTPGAFFTGSDATVGTLHYSYDWDDDTGFTYFWAATSVELSSPYYYYLQDYIKFTLDDAGRDGNENEYNLFFLNMNNLALHVVDYKPVYAAEGPTGDKYALFVKALSVNSNVSNANLMLMYCGHDDNYHVTGDTGTGALQMGDPVAVMEYELDEEIYDTVVTVNRDSADTYDFATVKHEPQVLIEKTNIDPDGNEYQNKKFRNWECMAKFPDDLFEILFAYDNKDYGTAKEISDDESLLVSGEYRGHEPHRIGLNQRAKSLSIKMRTTHVLDAVPNDTIWDFLEVSDMRLLWSYTGRSVGNASFDPDV